MLLRTIFFTSGSGSLIIDTITPTTTTLALSWRIRDDTDITDYIVEYKESSSGTWLVFSDGTSTTKSATITGLTSSTSYDVRVQVVGGLKDGTYSAVQTIFTRDIIIPMFTNGFSAGFAA